MALVGRNVLILVLLFLQLVSIHGHAGHNHDHHGHGHAHAHAGHHHHHDHDHDHDHEHNDEPPSFKYSQKANQAPAAPSAPSAPPVQAKSAQGSAGHQHAAHSHSGHQHGAHSHGAHQHGAGKHVHNTPPKGKVSGTSPVIQHPWFYALLSTLLISLAPFFILFWIPINANDEQNQPLLRIFLSFASGGLLGDAFLHLIPHAVPHSHGHGHDHGHGHSHHGHDHAEGEEEVHDHMSHTIVGLWVLAGIISFLIVEKVIRHLKGGHDHGHSHGHSHSHEHTPAVTHKKSRKNSEGEESAEERVVTRKSSHDESELVSKKGEDETLRQRKHGEDAGSSKEAEESVKSARAVSKERSSEHEIATTGNSGEIRVSGYLNLAADFAHNFTDGLAIGASFLAGQGIGWITTLTILFHEIPHEIGDFALLIQSGCSKPKAIALQLVTAVGAFSGCLVSLAFGSTATEDSSSPVLAFTAGGFIYIATVSVIPELLSDVKISQSIKEILALLTGIGFMVIIAIYE